MWELLIPLGLAVAGGFSRSKGLSLLIWAASAIWLVVAFTYLHATL